MKKFWNKLLDITPMLWGILWFGIITVGSVALLITVVQWLLRCVGVL